MNSDARRVLSQFDAFESLDLYQYYQYYADGQLRHRFASASLIVSVFVLAITVLYQLAFQQGWLRSLARLLWDALVVAIPARVLFAVDRFLHPSLFPADMLRSQQPARAAKSDALQRILGMNNASGILSSASQAGRRGFNKQHPPGSGIAEAAPGLSLRSFGGKGSHPSPTRTIDTLRDLMTELSGPSSNGRTLWTPKVLKTMSTWQQQDAQEYYSKLLDQIDGEIAKAARALQDSPGFESDSASHDTESNRHSDDSGYSSLGGHSRTGSEPRFARNPLEGLAAQRVACVNCGYCEGLTMIPFNCLTLTLGNLPEHDLYERLDHYTKVEAIQGVECPKCSLLLCRNAVKALAERTGDVPEIRQRLQVLEEALEAEAFDEETLTTKCKITAKARVSSTKTKQVALARPPKSLVFHVNRSGFDEATGYMFKNSAAVRFPMTLDLGPWCLGSAGAPAKLPGEDIAAEDIERWTLDPKASMVAGDRRPSRITGPIYELRAVVTHHGHHENGHYVCYRKHPASSIPTASKREGQADLAFEGGVTEVDREADATSEANGSAPDQDGQPSRWWRLSDEDVTRVDEETVLSQGGVFMLFYDCVEPAAVLVPAAHKSVATENAVLGIEVLDGNATQAEAQEMDSSALTGLGDGMELDDVLSRPGTAVATD
ncbi:41b5d75f-3645-4d09-b536-56a70377fe59 [Thermothielavioides terrestris]|uniref:ubiquitinyl hydrolase 1 n=1 Tax=Thermothielavioides terrestris TaxID=2587410 RepID=A0A3S4D3R9_9PEZI|nr:41b5d75f-3645-4d09-b536-56a70377fe59 [Thermothielavioides terrestris]